MTFLLDVNVLIPLIDPGHVAHDDAHEWFGAIGQSAWATCPITENGVIRIVGNPKYPNSPGSPSLVMDVSLVGSGDIAPTKILTSGQVTDTYLLAIAKARGGQLATFDRKVSAAAVTRGNSALHLITTSRS